MKSLRTGWNAAAVLYLALVPFVALAFAFPLFLCARERRLLRQIS